MKKKSNLSIGIVHALQCVTMNPAVVMLVEDDDDLRESLADALQQRGFRVVACQNGNDALNVIHKTPMLTAILLDLFMPITDGWGFRAIQKHLPSHRDVPLIVMSSGRNLATVAMQMGAAAWLEKPVAPERILETIEQVTPRSATSTGS